MQLRSRPRVAIAAKIELVVPSAIVVCWHVNKGVTRPQSGSGPAIRVVLFDIGGVICHLNWEWVKDAVGTRGFPVTIQGLMAADRLARKSLDSAAAVTRRPDERRALQYWKQLFALAGVPREIAAPATAHLREYHRTHNLWEIIGPDVISTLSSLRRDGLKLAAVSNSNGTVRKLLRRVGLEEYFDAIVDSAEYGIEKPDPRIFEFALRECREDPSTAAHVGDYYHVDILGAEAARITLPILFDPDRLCPGAPCQRIASLQEMHPLVGRRPNHRL